MPYVSDKHEAYLRINKPEVAKKFDAHSGRKKGKKRRRFKDKAAFEEAMGKML